jgi:hypothetical protein
MKLSFEEIRSAIYGLLEARKPQGNDASCWIESLYEDEVVWNENQKLYRAPYSIKDGEAILGEAVEVEKEVKYRPIFSVERLFTAFKEKGRDGFIVRTGKVFEAGDFPDKQVEFDEDDLETAVQTFAPVHNDLEHVSSILDGNLGKLEKVWKKGKELFGEVSIPSWLDDVIGDDPIKVSLAFDRSKRIVGNALVLRPRIADAAIMSAFSLATHQPTTTPKAKPPMKLKEAIKTFFGLDRIEDLEQEVTLPEGLSAPVKPDEAVPTAPAPTFSDPEKMAMEARLKAMETQFSTLSKQALTDRAFLFADETIRAKKALPAQRDQIAQMYAQAVTADANGGPVFSEGKGIVEGTQVAALKEFFNAAPTHTLAGEAISDSSILIFGKPGNQAGMDEEKKKKLLEMSSLGRAATGGKN